MNGEHLVWLVVGGLLGYYVVAHWSKTGAVA